MRAAFPHAAAAYRVTLQVYLDVLLTELASDDNQTIVFTSTQWCAAAQWLSGWVGARG